MITYLVVFLAIILFLTVVLALLAWPQLYMNLIHIIGPTQMGVVRKTISGPISFSISSLFSSLDKGASGVLQEHGEAGYQIDYLPTGWYIKPWPFYIVEKHRWPQIPADGKGIVHAQIGLHLDQGAKSAVYKEEFGKFQDVRAFLRNGGQQGPQRLLLGPGETLPIHPVAFLVITHERVFGIPLAPYLRTKQLKGTLTYRDFGYKEEEMKLLSIQPLPSTAKSPPVDRIGVVVIDDGPTLASGMMACRIDDTPGEGGDESHEGFDDIRKMESEWVSTDDLPLVREFNKKLLSTILRNKNNLHNSYQALQTFFDKKGRMGLQHDTLPHGLYNLHPLVNVHLEPMFEVPAGNVGVVKANIGLPQEDISDDMRRLLHFEKLSRAESTASAAGGKYRSTALVRPGHVGIWVEPLGPAKYSLNPHTYSLENIVTEVMTLDWGKAVSTAHTLDKDLSAIEAITKDRLSFKIDVQLILRITPEAAPFIVADFGNIKNMVVNVITTLIGNIFRGVLLKYTADEFMDNLLDVQKESLDEVRGALEKYGITVIDLCVMNRQAPPEIEKLWLDKAKAVENQNVFAAQEISETARILTEKARALANGQKVLADAELRQAAAAFIVEAMKKEAEGENALLDIREKSLGKPLAALLVGVDQAGKFNQKLLPEVLVMGGENSGVMGLLGSIRELLKKYDENTKPLKEEPRKEYNKNNKDAATKTGIDLDDIAKLFGAK